ncbi:Fungal specific transcription factor [Scheffersomyces stipitis CBS 6054]|uniref:Fungal specific transcription factor n=1 Tax=Scheffersomyces stipitis (strain ATCC 58785 / CBS 6054 / NBRC 10063 / NRRL Y-11545) TaxID=322104 RepID=A3LN31_PICST|nr:Fungal specific transcription factor [Scheffersomyces stipitis CBS 6054]ABN64789.2 Fungal specific transcription factor [Scheffersomyces stipitis CBS 6054]
MAFHVNTFRAMDQSKLENRKQESHSRERPAFHDPLGPVVGTTITNQTGANNRSEHTFAPENGKQIRFENSSGNSSDNSSDNVVDNSSVAMSRRFSKNENNGGAATLKNSRNTMVDEGYSHKASFKVKSEPRKRHRLTLVCNNCKKRKIKCNKQVPCDSCVKSGNSQSCCYDAALSPSNTTMPYVSSARRPIVLKEEQIVMPKRHKTSQDRKLIPHTTTIGNKAAYNAKNDVFHSAIVASNGNNGETYSGNVDSSGGGQKVNIYKKELDALKERIRQLESLNGSQTALAPTSGAYSAVSESNMTPSLVPTSSYAVDESAQKQMNLPPPPSSSILSSYSPLSGEQQSGSTSSTTLGTPSSVAIQKILDSKPLYQPTYNAPIKLPPINWKATQSSSTVSSTPVSDDLAKSRSHSQPDGNAQELTSLLGINPVSQQSDGINFYRFDKDTPFSWSSLMKSDDQLRSLLQYVKTQHAVLDEDISYPKSPSELEMFDTSTQEYRSLIRQTMSRTTYDHHQSLTDRITERLPEKEIVWLLIDRFFEFLYPFLPFVDQLTFIEDMERLLGPREQESTGFDIPSHIKLHKETYEHDMAMLGILLLMMRFGYLSLFRNNDDFNIETIQGGTSARVISVSRLLRHPISIDLAELARECLAGFNVLDENIPFTFSTLQLMFFMRFYCRLSPEDGWVHDVIDYHGAIVRMSLAMKLNIDPDQVHPSESPRMKNLRRKMWNFLVIADVHNSLAFGSPLYIKEETCHTKVVYITEENSNIIGNFEREKFIFEVVHKKSYDFHVRMKSMLKFILDRNSTTPLSQIVDKLNDFEVLVNEHFGGSSIVNAICGDCKWKVVCNKGDYVNILNEDDRLSLSCFERIHTIKVFLSINTFLMTIYYYMYLFYGDSSNNISWFYLKKSMIYITDLIPTYHSLLNESQTCSDFIINPTLQGLIHKSNQVQLSLIIKFSMNSGDEKLRSLLVTTYQILINLIGGISKRYYYAWKITKGHTYFLSVIQSQAFQRWMLQQGGVESRYSKYQLDGLKTIVSRCIDKTQENRENRRSGKNRNALTESECSENTQEFSRETSRTPPSLPGSNVASSPSMANTDQQWIDLIFNIKNDPATRELTLFDLFDELESNPLGAKNKLQDDK